MQAVIQPANQISAAQYTIKSCIFSSLASPNLTNFNHGMFAGFIGILEKCPETRAETKWYGLNLQ